MCAVTLGTMVGEHLGRLEADTRYRELVEMSPDAIAVHGEDRWVFANQAAVAMLGASDAKQIIGTDAFAVIHPDCHAFARART